VLMANVFGPIAPIVTYGRRPTAEDLLHWLHRGGESVRRRSRKTRANDAMEWMCRSRHPPRPIMPAGMEALGGADQLRCRGADVPNRVCLGRRVVGYRVNEPERRLLHSLEGHVRARRRSVASPLHG
jgi:hypothetical protein